MPLKLFDLLLIGAHDSRTCCLDDTLQQRINLFLGVANTVLCQRSILAGLGKAHIPQVTEHLLNKPEEPLRGLQGTKNLLEVPFELIAADRLAVADAAFRLTHIIRMLVARLACRPASGQRLVTITAKHEAAQREVSGDVLTSGRLGRLVQAPLNALVGLKADQGLMVPLAQRYAPVSGLYIACIDWARQHVGNALIANLHASQIFGECRLRLQEAFHLDLRLEAPVGEALKSLLQDRGDWLVSHEHFTMPRFPLKAIAERRAEHGIAVDQPRPHAVLGLFGILLALVLRNRGQHVLNQDRIRIFANLDGWTLKNAASTGYGRTKRKVRIKTSGKAGHIINDDDEFLALALPYISEHRLNAWTVDQPARGIVLKYFSDFMTLVARIFAAPRFLTGQARAALGLRRARYPYIDNRLLAQLAG